MDKKNQYKFNFYDGLFSIGKLSGCHQRADRSFFIKGKQFPVCARCTGAFVGYVLSAILFTLFTMPWWLCFLCCGIMFFDWFLQHKNIMQSNNFRRFMTGFLCGYAIMQMFLKIILFAFEFVSNIFK